MRKDVIKVSEYDIITNSKLNSTLTGRKQIFTSSEVSDATIVDIINTAFQTHLINSQDIDYLYNYYKGEQPILRRIKTIRPEICNRVVENHAYEIVEFKTGYTFGQPIQYVQRGKEEIQSPTTDEPVETNRVSKINEIMYLNDKATKDRELGEWMIISGTGYRMVLTQEEYPFIEIDTLDPRNTFVVYSTSFGKKPVLGVSYIIETNKNGEKVCRLGAYSKNRYWELISDNVALNEFRIVNKKPHYLGDIPIIEYPANPSRLGVFEPVLGLLDALNNTASNRMDGIEQFVQSIMKFINCDITVDDFKALKDLGALKVKSSEGSQANVEFMTQELDQSQSQTFVDYIYQTILTITGVPDRRSSAGGNTGQALTIGQGWTNAESRAVSMEQMFKSSELQFLKIVLNILKELSVPSIDSLTLGDIEVKFTRDRTDNLLVKTQGLLNMLEAGVHPRIALANSNLFPDPEQVFVDSAENMQKWKIDKGENDRFQKPNPPDIY